MLLLDIGMGSNDVSTSLSNSIFLGSSWIELRVKDDKTQEPVLFPVAPTPYLISKGYTLIGAENSLEKNHLLIQYPSSYFESLSNLINPKKTERGAFSLTCANRPYKIKK